MNNLLFQLKLVHSAVLTYKDTAGVTGIIGKEKECGIGTKNGHCIIRKTQVCITAPLLTICYDTRQVRLFILSFFTC